MPLAILSAVLLFLSASVAADLSMRRIPNALTFPVIVLALPLNAYHFGSEGLLASLGGMGLMVILLLPPFALGGIGGGDVKMMAAVGALCGPRFALTSLMAGLGIGGVVMLWHLARIGRLRRTLVRLRAMLAGALSTRSLQPLRVSANEPGAVSLPYSIPLAIGTLIALLAQRGV